MTIVAYREGLLASDTLITANETSWAYGKKIIKANGILAGGCGDMSFVQEFLHWASYKNRDELEPPKSSSSNQGIIISPKNILYYVGKKPIPLKTSYLAIGSGFEIALGAFWMGASAAKAVKAAMVHNIHCGGEIYCLEL